MKRSYVLLLTAMLAGHTWAYLPGEGVPQSVVVHLASGDSATYSTAPYIQSGVGFPKNYIGVKVEWLSTSGSLLYTTTVMSSPGTASSQYNRNVHITGDLLVDYGTAQPIIQVICDTVSDPVTDFPPPPSFTDQYSGQFSFDFSEWVSEFEPFTANVDVIWSDGLYHVEGHNSVSLNFVNGYAGTTGIGIIEVGSEDAVRPVSVLIHVENSTGYELLNTSVGFELISGDENSDRYYEANGTFSQGNGEEVDPEITPPPIDPTNPPDPGEDVDPAPGTPGGDTNPDVAVNYDDFREAVEKALDNRALSGMEIHEAVQQALADQNLSNEAVQNAMENALNNMGLSQSMNRDAVQSALARQGLSGSNIAANIANALRTLSVTTDGLKQSELEATLESKGLTGQGIGDAVSSGVGQAVGDAMGGSDGGSYTGGGTPEEGSYEEAENGVGQDLGEMTPDLFGDIAGQMESKLRSMFIMQLPAVGQNPVFSVQLPAFMSITLPPLIVDLDDLQYVPWIRSVLVFCLYVGAFFRAMKIVGDTF